MPIPKRAHWGQGGYLEIYKRLFCGDWPTFVVYNISRQSQRKRIENRVSHI